MEKAGSYFVRETARLDYLHVLVAELLVKVEKLLLVEIARYMLIMVILLQMEIMVIKSF